MPAPASVQPTSGVTHTIPSSATIHAAPGATEVASYLAALLRRSTGYALPVATAGTAPPGSGISLLLSGADAAVGTEGYQLDVTSAAVVIRAQTAAGLFHGVQTLRQLLPASVESVSVQPGPWTLPGGRIVDHPRFAYRGAMLDVARHFHPVATVKQYLDQIALYKINYLHLHLSDDQGWRIAIDSWPRLATHGGSTQVGGGPGGYYMKAQFQEIVAHAASRYITVVPEIDMPGHTNAALASYAELNCNGVAPPLYTGTEVGFSSLCTTKEITYTFVDQVLGELAALTPGPFLHIGGDEANVTPAAQYAAFVNRVQPMVPARGKAVMGWHQIGASAVQHSANRVVQYWGLNTSDALVSTAVSRGARVVMSPANRAYLDMKYNSSTPIGLSWAGFVEVQTAYGWDPGAYLSGVPASAVLGVEAPMWTETIVTADHIEFMAFPRLPAIAELGWSPWSTHSWDSFRLRLGAQGPRWTAMGIDFYRSTQVPWATASPTTAPPTTPSTPPTSSPPSGGVVNGGFESGSLIPWTGTRCSIVTSPVRSGSRALAGAVTASDNARCQQVVAVRPNTTYRLQAHVRGSYVYLGAAGTGTSDVSAWTPNTGGAFSPLTVTFTTGPSTTSTTVYLHGWYGQGNYHADDVSLS
ncbi:beta-N-acetylhexosaminidase [Phytohabitans houttuyneae]|uniref:beta-N-acetylhexosaminidase n=1 Tax=Phytohabitans houttuyneae TaxID=1076126 RepID=A0A6V8KD77_9ACTN|nr:beta-N-acetylhexosaminidase [Phytohabitans houttuyneae]